MPSLRREKRKPAHFLVGNRAQHSVLLKSKGKVSSKKSWVQGARGIKQYSWNTQRTVELRIGRVIYSFFVVPECPYSLLGKDLLTKMKEYRWHERRDRKYSG